ncbi:MAG TPA: transglutaminase domain-containing protein [Candidatus Methanoperedens sp.]|nr:transglutaminase domain-containing protein [Candidatus Methanoperedens sp.]
MTTANLAVAAGRAGTVVLQVDLSAQPQGLEARLWLPYPVTDRHQTIADIRVAGDSASSGVYTDREHGTPILYAEWPKEAASRKLSLSFSVEREEVVRGELPATEPAWNPADYAAYLGATSLGPIDGEVKALAEKITAGKKTVLEKARAIYDWTCENMYRDPDVKGCGKGDVCALLKKPGGKCTDISSVFIALCRASGVPTREVFGIRLGKKPEEDITAYQHCWVEFFLPGRGWVSVDPADFRKAVLVDKLDLVDPKAKELREYFWGNVDAYRFVVAEGRDIVLNPRQAGPPLNTFGYPYAEIDGNPLDFYTPKGFVYTYTFKGR